jgi:hypothetical protein
MAGFFQAADTLYRADPRVYALLNTGKPEIFYATGRPTNYLFFRPDLIITPAGFVVCEVETSPFGLALAEIVNRAYTQEGFETLVADGVLSAYVHAHTPTEGTILYSRKTSSFAGQMTFLADQVFSGERRVWTAQPDNNAGEGNEKPIYRGFYLVEYLSDPAVTTLLDAEVGVHTPDGLLPSPTPHMEEKALLALLWDSRYEHYFQCHLGQAAFNHLRNIVPPTWIVGQEQYFSPGLPDGVSTSIDLANLSRSKRTFVLKTSGFSKYGSWAEGVSFLHEKSVDKAREILHQAQEDTSSLHIIQQFRRGQTIPLSYENEEGSSIPMAVRIRLTPYFSAASGHEGKLIAIKATGCEDTDFIHASSTSINTAVSR